MCGANPSALSTAAARRTPAGERRVGTAYQVNGVSTVSPARGAEAATHSDAGPV